MTLPFPTVQAQGWGDEKDIPASGLLCPMVPLPLVHSHSFQLPLSRKIMTFLSPLDLRAVPSVSALSTLLLVGVLE